MLELKKTFKQHDKMPLICDIWDFTIFWGKWQVLCSRDRKVAMLHGTHGYFRSMDRILRPWEEYLSIKIGTSSWSYSTHLMGKNPSIAYIIFMDKLNIHEYLMDLLLLLALYLRPLRPYLLLLLLLLFIISLPLLAIH